MKPVGLATICLVLIAQAGRAESLSPYQQMGRDIYQELVDTDTSHSKGDTTKAAELVARRFLAEGFPEQDVQVIGPEPRNKNLVVRYRGSGAKAPIVLIAHLDVVEAKKEDWSFEPFRLTERDGFFYGRGTSDNKDGDATLAAALLRLHRENFQPDRDLILALTAGEEGGVYNGVDWLLTKHRELVNGTMCLNADAGGPQKRKGKFLLYGMQAAEKTYQSYRLEVKGPGGHSSRPTPDNPIYQLARGLVRLSDFQFPVQLNEITRDYFTKMSELETGQTATDMKGVLSTPPSSEVLKNLSAIPAYNALLRTTAVATMLEAGHAENALPQTARAIVNCRLLPGETPEHVLQTIKQVLADDRITVTPTEPSTPTPPSPLSPEIVAAVQQAKEKLWPQLPFVAEMETGASDGVYFRKSGIPTYGISGIAVDLEDDRAHGKDERVAVADFYNGLEFQYQLLKAITSARGN